jgi:hypothetical protein
MSDRQNLTAAEKVTRSLRDLSRPQPGAAELELTLASVAMGLESSLREEMTRMQPTGELDEFILALTRWIGMHTSDDTDALVVVRVPQRALKLHDLPHGIGLERLNEAIAASSSIVSPL